MSIFDVLFTPTKTPLKPEERNHLRHPTVAPAIVRHGVLFHTTAGAVTGAGSPERVSVFLGPGATFEGLADTVLPLYTQAAASGGPAAPTRDELARALIVYNQDRLPTADWSNHRVGLRLLLPVEISVTDWFVNADLIRAWARPGPFLGIWGRWQRRPPTPLDVPEPAALESAALAISILPAALLAPQLWAQVLTNPFEAVLRVLAVLRTFEARAAGTAADVALRMLDGATPHQAEVLAGTSAGNGVLRRLRDLLKPPGTPGDPARLAAARALLDDALTDGTPARLVPHRELPLTPDQLKARAGEAKPAAGAATDPPGGLHRLVLGRDLAVGRNATKRAAGVSTTGPTFAGRVPTHPTLLADAARLNPADDPRRADLLTVLGGSPAVGRFDAVDAGGPAPLTVGLDHWSALVADQLPRLLLLFKRQAADEFDLFFALHGLDVDEPDPVAHPGHGRLRRIGPDGAGTPMDAAAVRTFLGASGAGGTVTIAPEWAARFRLPALVSAAYRRAQVDVALARLLRVAPTAGVDAVMVTPAPRLRLTVDGPAALPPPAPAGSTTWTVHRTMDRPVLDTLVGPSYGRFGRKGRAFLTHGQLVEVPGDPTRFDVPTALRIVYPQDPARPGVVAGTKRLPVAVIVHGNHAALQPEYTGLTDPVPMTRPGGVVVTVPVHRDAATVRVIPNHEGYARLQELLAAAGIVSVSVNTNAANALGSLLDLRTTTVMAALEQLRRFDLDTASRFHGRLDLRKLGLMGHSRGGEVVVDLARRLRGHAHFRVRTVCSLAPTDFTGTITDATRLAPTPADAAFYLVVYGSLDGDVSGFGGADDGTGTGFRLYDRATCPKAMVQLSRCCHNRFNTVWSNGTLPPVPPDPILEFRRDDSGLMPADVARLRTSDEHQKLEVEYVGGLFRWQLLGHHDVTGLLDGTRSNRLNIPASLQWSFGARVLDVDDLERATPSLPGATRTLSVGTRDPFTDITVPGNTLATGAPAAPVAITAHASHRSQVLHVDATAPPATAEAMTVTVPAATGNWTSFTYLTFRLSFTLDISDVAGHAASPLPRASIVLADAGGRTHRVSNATAFSIGVPAAPDLHFIQPGTAADNATLFRFETVRVPLASFRTGGVDLARVRRLVVESDRANGTHVMFDSFRLVKV